MASASCPVDTGGGMCLLCLTSENCSPLANICQLSKLDSTTAGFKMLLRYLKVDLMKLRGPNSRVENSVNLGISLCDDCSEVTNDFLELYQALDGIRLQLDLCIRQVQESMGKGGEDRDRVREFQRRVGGTGSMDEILGVLRGEIMEKVFQKVGISLPRISLKTFTNAKQDTDLSAEESEELEPPTLQKCDEVGVHRNPTNRDMMDDTQTAQPQMQPTTSLAWECVYCETSCARKDNLLTHQFMQHAFSLLSDKGALPLHISEQQLNTSVESIVAQHGSQPRQCPFCERWGFQTKSVMRTHLLQRHLHQVLENLADRREEYLRQQTRCIPCRKYYSSNTALQSHQISMHTMNYLSREGRLPQGTSETKLEQCLAKMLAQVEESVFQCPLCDRRGFNKRKSHLRTHLLQSHLQEVLTSDAENDSVEQSAPGHAKNSTVPNSCEAEQPKIWRCVPCKRSFTQKHSYQSHQISKHATAYLSKLGQLPKHISEQQLEKAVADVLGKVNSAGVSQCPLCRKTGFSRKYHLRVHLLLRHLQQIVKNVKKSRPLQHNYKKGRSLSTTKRSLWRCVPCKIGFTQKSTLESHQLNMHPISILSAKGLLPPGVSEHQLNAALTDILGEQNQTKASHLQCPLCNELQGTGVPCVKPHILRKHLQQVLDKVNVGTGSVPGETPPPTPSSRKKMVGRPRQPARAPKPKVGGLVKCPQCRNRISRGNLMRHQFQRHPKVMLRNRLPPSVSTDSVIAAATRIASETKKIRMTSSPICTYECLWCKRRIWNDLKVHLLRSHLNQVVREVEGIPQ